MQKFWKLVKIWQSYREFTGGPFFWDTVYKELLPEPCKSHGLISVSSSISQTDTSLHSKTTDRGLMHYVACLLTPQLLRLLAVLTHWRTVTLRWPEWFVTLPRWFTRSQTHHTANEDRHRANSLIKTNTLPLSQVATSINNRSRVREGRNNTLVAKHLLLLNTYHH